LILNKTNQKPESPENKTNALKNKKVVFLQPPIQQSDNRVNNKHNPMSGQEENKKHQIPFGKKQPWANESAGDSTPSGDSGISARKVIDKNNIIETIYYIDGFELYRREVNGAIDYERTTLNISDDEKVFVRVEKKTNEPEIVRYQYDNHLGSACLELDYTGRIISYEEYHPFGTTSYRSGRSETEVSLKRYKYCGKERDEQTGFYYYGMRYYAGWLCRFVSVDPMADEYPSLTPYAYCGNNPINRIDPDGRDWYQFENENGTKTIFWQEGNAKTATLYGQIYNNIGETYLDQHDWGAISFNQNNVTGVYLYMSVSDLSVSDKGLNFLIAKEGLRLEPYNDSKGFATIGVGHLIAKRARTAQDEKDWAWLDTEKEVMNLLKDDLSNTYEKAIKSLVKVPLMQFQYDAIVSFTFNVGVGGLKKSDFLKELNNGIYDGNLMLNYQRPPEIAKRRKKEVNLFNTATYTP
jgi:RHS repeat-associated protein